MLERSELARAAGYDAGLQPTMDTSWSPAGEAGDIFTMGNQAGVDRDGAVETAPPRGGQAGSLGR